MKIDKLFFIFLILTFLSCKKEYKIDYKKPDANSTVNMLFPEYISEVKKIPYACPLEQGIAYSYFNIGVIWVYRAAFDEIADRYFENELFLFFESKDNNVKIEKLGKQKIIFIENKNYYAIAWINENWLFFIEANSKKNLELLIDKFDWIS